MILPSRTFGEKYINSHTKYWHALTSGDEILNKVCKPLIVVHGGAGDNCQPDRSDPAIQGVKRAAKTGYEILKKGGSAVDCVSEAVAVLEDEGIFNAGYGSSLNLEKKVQMEASIMDGQDLRAGAVGLLRDIKNPVRLARFIMDKTDHVLVVGDGAERLAELHGFERRDPVTERGIEIYEQQKKALFEWKSGMPRLVDLVKAHPELFSLETVGAVAMDKRGNLAAASSTGGLPLKLPGRMGDSSLIGCGTYADNSAGACVATGFGEIAIKLVLAKTTCNQMENGKTAEEAAELGIALVNRRLPTDKNDIGLVAMDREGRIGVAHNSDCLSWAYMAPDIQKPFAAMTGKIVKRN